MKAPSKKRQKELLSEESVSQVMCLHDGAVERWGIEAVNKDLTRIWDLRCCLGMQGSLPFGSTVFTCLPELLWTVRQVYQLGEGGNGK